MNRNSWFWWLLILYVIPAAYLSEGFLHADEHFQILEFANFKAGGIPAEMLPWEFPARLRPWFQPGWTYLALESLGMLGVDSPRIINFIFRLFTATLAVGACFYFLSSLRRSNILSFRQEHAARWMSLALWYLPFLWVRHTSESWSSAFFFLGAALQLDGFRKNKAAMAPLVWSALLFAVSFHARFQTGFMILGFGLWMLWIRKQEFRKLFVQGLAFFCFFGLCVVIDRWGYGEWTFTPWTYLKVNIFEGKANSFGVSPWYYYFVWPIHTFPPISLLPLLATLWFFYRNPRHVLTWIFVPFVLIHSMVGHKEGRFLISLYWMVPVMIVVFWDQVLAQRLWAQKLRPWYLGLSVVGGLAFAWTPCRSDVAFLTKIWDVVDSQHEQIEIWDFWDSPTHYQPESPYILAGLLPYFYSHPRAQRIALPKSANLDELLSAHPNPEKVWVLVSPVHHPAVSEQAQSRCTLTERATWDWIGSSWRLSRQLGIKQWHLYTHCKSRS